MDLASVIPSLVSVLTTAFIGAVKDPIGRAFENRTKRVQFWKTMLDAAPLADVTDITFFKEQCRNEMAGAVDAVAAVSNKFVGEVSVALLLGIGIFVLSVMGRVSADVLNKMQQNGVPVSTANQFGIVSAILQAAVISLGWFWGRWKLRRWVWTKIKPGAHFEILLRNTRLQGIVRLLCIFGLLFLIWLTSHVAFSG